MQQDNETLIAARLCASSAGLTRKEKEQTASCGCRRLAALNKRREARTVEPNVCRPGERNHLAAFAADARLIRSALTRNYGKTIHTFREKQQCALLDCSLGCSFKIAAKHTHTHTKDINSAEQKPTIWQKNLDARMNHLTVK